MNTLCRIVLGSIALAAVSPAAAQSEWDNAAELYGRGVHAYFAGRAAEADDLLSRALAVNPHDPRLYYFRGLSRQRLGSTAAARADMAAGAEREARQFNRYPVGAALQRVQGSDRLLLEEHRRQARAKAVADADLSGRKRLRQLTAGESDVLREKIVVPLDELFRPEGPRPLTADELSQRPVFGAQSAATASAVSTPPQPALLEAEPLEAAPSAPTTPSSPAPAAQPESPPASDAEDDPFSDFR